MSQTPLRAGLAALAALIAAGLVACTTVGALVANLLTLPQEMPFYTAYHVEISGKRVTKTTNASLSRETVAGGRIQKYDASKQSLVIWATSAPSSTGGKDG